MKVVLPFAGLALMVAGMLGLLATDSLFSRSPVLIAAQAAAVALMIWARVTFGFRSFHAGADPTAGGLVTSGPYKFIRHPIYTAVCLFAGAGVAAHPSLASAALGVAVLAGALARMLAEETMVRRMYPEYEAYSQTTKRMIPFVF
jgi:protein-S-isoprenylcysteine O-methyltransferase Ste14